MIKDPIAIIAVLLCIEGGILFLASYPRTKGWFEFIPSIFWIYFLPMLASTFGLIDPQSPIYGKITNTLLPMALFLLLVTVDIRAILRLGPAALTMFFIGAVGIALGTCAAFALFKPLVGAQFWSGFGALSASWTGGSANMIAVKEALGTPDEVFLPMVIVDTVVPYVWMALLVIACAYQGRFDKLIKADRSMIDDLGGKSFTVGTVKLTWLSAAGIIVLGIAGGLLAKTIAGTLPIIPNIVSTYAWTIIVVSSLAIIISFTPIKNIQKHGSNTIGYFVLYFVLTSIGAKASISHLGNAAVLIAAGFLIITVHVVVLLLGAKVLRAPLFLVAVASQANVGGVASAPMVAEIYQKGFASVGLLLAILGNIAGTYIGILVGNLCRLLS